MRPTLPRRSVWRVVVVGAGSSAGANPAANVVSLVAGMAAGADSIEDVDRLRYAGNHLVFATIWAASTLRPFLGCSATTMSSSRTGCCASMRSGVQQSGVRRT
ncbi:MAG: hypothetical protein ACRCYU_21200 [Nocardioides sp.]